MIDGEKLFDDVVQPEGAARKSEAASPGSEFAGQRALDVGRTQKSEKIIAGAALRDPLVRHFVISKTPEFQFFLANRRPDSAT